MASDDDSDSDFAALHTLNQVEGEDEVSTLAKETSISRNKSKAAKEKPTSSGTDDKDADLYQGSRNSKISVDSVYRVFQKGISNRKDKSSGLNGLDSFFSSSLLLTGKKKDFPLKCDNGWTNIPTKQPSCA